jgi:hypothetical protein
MTMTFICVSICSGPLVCMPEQAAPLADLRGVSLREVLGLRRQFPPASIEQFYACRGDRALPALIGRRVTGDRGGFGPPRASK